MNLVMVMCLDVMVCIAVPSQVGRGGSQSHFNASAIERLELDSSAYSGTCRAKPRIPVPIGYIREV
jgi:hypothetical protein